MKHLFFYKRAMIFSMLLLGLQYGHAQTDQDAIMMNKNQFCTGLIYMHGSWDHYWEGTLKRDNENLGTVSSNAVMYMANYGITHKLNVLVGLPYVWTKASAGTLHKMHGLQDFSLALKWKPITKTFGQHTVSLFTVGDLTTPTNNYVIDYLPLSIGLGTTNLSGRLILDYIHHSHFFVTGSAAYIWRSNVKLDREAYYDTRMHLTNQVKMPNALSLNLRAGYRGKYLIAEAVLNDWKTLGGFDITRNNMPFPSNKMNATNVGVQFKYTIKQFTNLAILGGATYTIAGRNMGQTTAYNAGVFYAFYFNKKSKPVPSTSTKK